MSEKRVDIFNLLKNEGRLETLLVYSAQEIILDPYEHNAEKKFMNPLPIKGLIQQIGFSALHYKYWGQIPTGSIQVIIEKKNKTLILTADKIIYNEQTYKVYKDDSQNFAIIERPDYVVVVLGLKND
jgi:hypothetical protein